MSGGHTPGPLGTRYISRCSWDAMIEVALDGALDVEARPGW